MSKWKIKDSKVIFKEKIFILKDLDCYLASKDLDHHFHVLETFDWINVVALTEEQKFILVKQHRLGTNEVTIETPGGIVEKNEPAQNSAERELLEETGFKTGKIFPLKKLAVNPAIINNQISFFYASDCRLVSAQNLDLAEDIEVLLCSEEEVLEMIKTGQINHSIVITALSLYFLSKYSKSNIGLID